MKNKGIIYKENALTLIELILVIIIVLLLIIISMSIKRDNNKIYENTHINRDSEWYVNNLYMSDQYYYNNILNDEEKEVYGQIFNCIKNMNEEFIYTCSRSSFDKVMHAIMCDHPEMINFTVYSSNNRNNKIIFKYLCADEESLNKKIEEMQYEIYKISKDVNKELSDYEKEKIIYEILAERSYYGGYLDNSDQSAYTAIMKDKSTVCAGYAKAAQILFQTFNIKSFLMVNNGHMWNLVKLDDEYYYFDATPSSDKYLEDGFSHSGLNQNINTSNYESPYLSYFPSAEGTKYNYYDYEGKTLIYDKKDLSNIEQILNENKRKKVEIKVKNERDFLNDINNIKEKLNLRYIKYCGGYLSNSKIFFLRKK